MAEQERQVAELRGRASVLLAAGAVVPSLLAKSVFHGPTRVASWRSPQPASASCRGRRSPVRRAAAPAIRALGFSMKAGKTYRELWRQAVTEQPTIDLALDERRQENSRTVSRLGLWLALALGSLVLETLGLALAAAVAS